MSDKKTYVNEKNLCIGYLFFFIIVCLLSFHMYSYFLRLTFVNTYAVDEFTTIMAMYRGERISVDILFYWPVVLLIWLGHFWMETAKLYKIYILFAIGVNYLQACIFFRVVCLVEQKRLSVVQKIAISAMAYLGVPTYCFLYGGYIKSTLLVCMFWCVVLYAIRYELWNKLREKNYLIKGKNSLVVVAVIYIAVICSGILAENSYMIPFWIILLIDGFAMRNADTGVIFVNAISAFIFMVCTEFGVCDILKMMSLTLYWETCWLLIPQALRVVKKHQYLLEMHIYMAFLITLLGMQCLGIAGKLGNVRDDFTDDMMGTDQYYDIYGQNLELIHTDYTDETNEFFYGSSEYIELCDRLIKHKEEGRALVLADELTEDERKWAGAITGAETKNVNGLSITDEELRDIFQQYDYIVMFSDSRVYMAHYEYITNYIDIYNNDEGRIIWNSGKK